MRSKSKDQNHPLLPIDRQIKAWQRANRKMGWGIKKEELEMIGEPPSWTENDRQDGFMGIGLFYGFGEDGKGNSDPVLSGRLAWEYALRLWRVKTWQCEYIDFTKSDNIRLRPEAPPRPRGFYFAKFQPGEKYQSLTVSRLRKRFLDNQTGCGPEGIQLLAVTNTHLRKMMEEKKIPFSALADYDVAPYGFNDFFDAAQIFFSNGVLGLGIGNLDRNYPLFGIPTLRF
ncbi:MAG: hypothetical protein V3W43_16615 [Desulfatiglandaceae bacterium]